MSNIYKPNRIDRGQREVFNIEGAGLLFKNFSGAPTKFDTVGGKRDFCLELDDELAAILDKKGFNIKMTRPRDEEYDPVPYLKIKVGYKFKAPSVFLMQGKKRIELTEATIGTLDWADIENVDLSFSASAYDFAGKKGISAYLQSMHVVVREDAFASKYTQYDEDVADEEMPFE